MANYIISDSCSIAKIPAIAIALHNCKLIEIVTNTMGIDLDDLEYDMLYNFMHNQIDPFVTKEMNYN